MGSIRRRGSKYSIRYYDTQGIQREESGFRTKKDAKDALAIREAAKAKGQPILPTLGKVTFNEAAADLISDYKRKGNRSLPDAERRIAKHLRPFFGAGTRMATITRARIVEYQNERLAPVTLDDGEEKPGAAPATVNQELALLKRMFSLAIKGRKLLHDHKPDIPMLGLDNVREGFLTRQEFEDVRDELPPELRGLVTLLYTTGWRKGEALSLQWGQVDRETQVIRLPRGSTKNKKPRSVPYGSLPELVDVIEAAWAKHERLAREGTLSPFVFNRGGDEIRSFRRAWKTACQAAGVPGVLIHDMRRSSVRNLIRAGVPEKTAMAITGHVTRSVFDRCNIVDETDKADALGRLAGAGEEADDAGGRVERMPGR